MLLWWQLAQWPAELFIHLYGRLPRPDRATSLRDIGGSPMKWVTREQIRVNRTATCWLIRRFLDPKAEFLFMPAESVASMQAELDATGFDAPGATYPHQDAQGLCSFAALVRERLANDPVLLAMADIVQAADIK